MFLISIGLVVYTYAGFPLLLLLRAVLFRRPYRQEPTTPQISVIIAAYNEEVHLRARIENLFAQEYPAGRMEVVLVSDGSTDRTSAIAGEYARRRVHLIEQPRQGKAIALNAGVSAATGEVLVFTDANSEFAPRALTALLMPFADPKVGGVVGNQVYLRSRGRSDTADGERLYWSFDQAIKGWQSAAGNVTSATGAIYAVRRELFEPIPSDAMDDFMVSTGVIARGHRLVYANEAVAREPVAEARGVEFSRKVRIITQGLRSVFYRRKLLVPWRYGFYSLQLFTHKVLRRGMVFPLLAMAVTGWSLWDAGWLYRCVWGSEVALCTLACIAVVTRGKGWGSSKLVTLPYYFCVVNAAVLAAVWNLMTRRGVHRWEPERHQQSAGASLERLT